jgi:hypothetical protein
MVGTTESLGDEHRLHKDQLMHEVGPPGPELAQKIALGLRRGRPGYWIGKVPGSDRPLGIPKATTIRFTPAGKHDFCPPVESPLAVLPHSLVLALETQDPIAFQQLGKNNYDLGRYLYAAALRDILGLTEEEIAEPLGFGGEDSLERSARRVVSQGRKLWFRVGAWPWWYFEPAGSRPAGRPPDRWLADGGGPHVDAAFATWATGRIHSPAHFGRAPSSRAQADRDQ